MHVFLSFVKIDQAAWWRLKEYLSKYLLPFEYHPASSLTDSCNNNNKFYNIEQRT